MPRPINDEELILRKRARRRLIGAIALVMLVIVVLPMFLDSEPRPLNQDISIQIPAQSTEFSSPVAAPGSTTPGDRPSPPANVAETRDPPETPPSATTEAADKPASETSPTKPETSLSPDSKPLRKTDPKPAAKPARKTEPKPASTREAKLEPKPEPKPEPRATAESSAEQDEGASSYIVQVAAYIDADRAKSLKSRIANNGLRAYTEVVKTAKGDVTRVRVGPFPSREAAEKAASQLKSIGLSGVVAPRG